jgi:hypothetical protein
MLTQVEVEQRISRILDEMEVRTEVYDQLCRQAAESEAQYRREYARTMLSQIAMGSDRGTADQRKYRADRDTADLHEKMLLRVASRNSCRESLVSLREMLNALRTLAASLRVLT